MWIKIKGILFLLVGTLAAALLILECPTWKAALPLALTVWCFCRFYYFTFYVVEHYVDPGHRFSALWSLTRYLLRKNESRSKPSGRDTT